MARLQFPPLERYPFRTELQIYTSHINHGNHLDNAQLLTLVSEARLRFWRWLGYDESEVLGLGTVVGDQGVQYLSESFHGEVLVIEMAPADLNRYGFDVCFRVREKSGGRDVARGKIGVVLFDKQARKAASMPDALRDKLLSV